MKRPAVLALAPVAGAVFLAAMLSAYGAPCTGAGCLPPAVTIAVTPNPATVLDTIQISGIVTHVPAGTSVTLWGQRSRGASPAAPQAFTSTDGSYEFFIRTGGVVPSSRVYFATAAGASSPLVAVQAQAAVALTASTLSARVGQRVALTGEALPLRQRAQLWLQQRLRGRWQTLAIVKLNRSGRFRASERFQRRRDVELRAAYVGRQHRLLGVSPVLTIYVPPLLGIHKIRHVVIIMQENRSFDSYFGTYPGADGIPHGVCVPDPLNGGCLAPYWDSGDANEGGPHTAGAANDDIDQGRMDGFIGVAENGFSCSSVNPTCSPCRRSVHAACVDVMGYHDAREIPNYWDYARHFVLQDHMFSPVLSWSLPAHLYMVSGWSAECASASDPFSCTSSLYPVIKSNGTYTWTDVTYLLHRAHVSWGYYVFAGTEPDCESNAAVTCAPVQQAATTPSIWNPLPRFTSVLQDGQLGNVQSANGLFQAAEHGTLPAVSWVIPNGLVSEHGVAGRVSVGETYVTGVINALMRSPDWPSTAIFLSWDDWGGFYDHVVPPVLDGLGYGLRVPGLLISPYARRGFIDHQVLSHDAYLKFIEDDFLGGQRLDPNTDGRPDLRPDVRESAHILGNLLSEFDFNQKPRPPLILPVHPAPGPASTPP